MVFFYYYDRDTYYSFIHKTDTEIKYRVYKKQPPKKPPKTKQTKTKTTYKKTNNNNNN